MKNLKRNQRCTAIKIEPGEEYMIIADMDVTDAEILAAMDAEDILDSFRMVKEWN